jgi:hypothetical protein
MENEPKGTKHQTKPVRLEQQVKQRKKRFDPRKHQSLLDEGLREYDKIWQSLAKK